jgi:4-amino-4-deoxy-L-arabinose transferase-like glycosyltransferase
MRILAATSWTDRQICIAFFLFAMLLCLPCLFFRISVPRDTAHFYGPMIREFADGNFSHAFYPLIPPLFASIGGAIGALTSLPPFATAKLTSALFFALTVFPLFALNKQLFNRRTAIISLFLLCVSGLLLRQATSGTIDLTKMFFLIAACRYLFAFIALPTVGKALLIGGCCAAMTLARGEGIAVAVLMLALLFIIALKKRTGKALWSTACAILLFFLLISPWVLYEYNSTGYPVTDSRQIVFIDKLQGLLKKDITGKASAIEESAAIQELLERRKDHKNTTEQFTYTFYKNIVLPFFVGLEPLYLLMAVAGMVVLWRRDYTSNHQYFALAIILLHTVILLAALGGQWMSSRYVMQAMPLMLGFSAAGGEFICSLFLNRKGGRIIIGVLMALVMVYGTYRGAKYAFPSTKYKETSAIKASSDWIQEHASRISNADIRLASTNLQYHNGRAVKILAYNGLVPFQAGAESVMLRTYGQAYTPEDVAIICKAKHINFIVVERRLLEANPALKELKTMNSPIFKPLFSAGEGKYRHWIIGYLPNLSK